MDLKKVENIEIEEIDVCDNPNFCDVFIVKANYNGIPMNNKELEELNKNKDFIYEQLEKQLF